MQPMFTAFFAPGPFELLIIGLMLLLFAVPVIVVLVIVSKNRGSPPRFDSSQCPDCGAKLSKTDEDCPSCGRVIM